MSADELLQYLTWLLFVLVFLSTLAEGMRRPLRANLDIALLFFAPALAIFVQLAVAWRVLPSDPLLEAACGFLILALPYLLVRLVDDFSRVPPSLLRLAEAGLALLVLGWFALDPPRPAWYYSAAALYFVGGQLHATTAFAAESRLSSGVTKRRMQAVAIGSVFLGLAILAFALGVLLPAHGELWAELLEISALLSGFCYFLGFATPPWLRRAWQAPELRPLLRRATALTRLPDTASIVHELESGAAAALGAPSARIGLWDETAQRLNFGQEGKQAGLPPDQGIAGLAFAGRQAILSTNLRDDDPAHSGQGGKHSAWALLAAPIAAGEKRLGVLVVYAPRASIFARDDLDLLQLLAAQAAVLLESRALMEEAASVRAREEIAYLKEDFLSAAAHDLKTPLTVLLGQAQLLERRALRDPGAPADLEGIQRLVGEARRMKGLVYRLLDASRVEQGRLLGIRERTDLVEIARVVCRRERSAIHRCLVEAAEPVIGEYDRARVAQLVENLVDNGVKYSPEGGEVLVKVWLDKGEAHLTVADHGIGIPLKDQPHLFERFHRGANVDDRRFAGMGLGLYICRGVVEEHGGRLWVTSSPGQGSTLHVALPAIGAEVGRSAA